MSIINVDNVLPLSVVLPGDNTPVNVNGAKIFSKGLGFRSLSIGENQKATTSGYSISADYVGLGFGIFPPATGFQAQTIAIGSLIGDLSASNSCGQSILIGTQVVRNVSGGSDNVIIGYQSAISAGGPVIDNTIIGSQAASALSTGFRNSFFGRSAGANITTGANNISIGYNSAPATATTSNSVTLGNSSITALRCAVTSITSLSDARDKKEVEDLNVGLEFIDGLRPVKFVWDDRNEEGKHDIADFGFIAQDLKAAEDAVDMAYVLKLVYDENPEKLEASYGKLIPILVKAVQELSAEVKLLKNK